MKTSKTIFLLVIAFTLSILLILVFNIRKPDEASISENYKNPELIKPKLFFEANQGQVDENIKFISKGLTHTLLLSKDEASLSFHSNESRKESFVRMKFQGTQKQVRLSGRNKLIGRTNYLMGNNPDSWITNIPNYTEVIYKDIYPGINLVFYGNDGLLEYDFIISQKGDPKNILIEFDSKIKRKIDKHGNLIFKNKNTEVIINAPVAYQIRNKERKIVDAKFVKQKNGCIGFELGNYDKDLPVVIDPKIIFSTFFSNNTRANANDIALDSVGNIYITGTNNGINFPVTHDNLRIDYNDGGPENVFVTKMNSDGTELLYSTYFGGTYEDFPQGIAVDHEGNIIVCGQTFSRNFPLVNAIQTTFRGDEYSNQTNGDAFIAKINPEGDEFVYSTYLGGEYDDCAKDIAVDNFGNAFVTGWHDYENFPYKNPIGILECGDYSDGAFVAKINPGGALEFATCLGGGKGYGIALDRNNDVYITGSAYSGFYTTSGAYRTEGSGAFVQKLDHSGSSINYSTFLYRKQYDDESCRTGQGNAIVVDTLGNAYIVGVTGCDRLSLVNEFQSTGESFVAKLSADGSSLLFASYFGGTNINEYPSGIDIDGDGDIYVTGITFSSDFPIVDGFQKTLNNNSDAYVAMIDGKTFELAFASYLGGNGWEGGIDSKVGIAVNGDGYVHLAGYGTEGFPVENAMQETTVSGDAYVVKLIVKEKGILKVAPSPLIFPLTEPGQTTKETIELSNSGIGALEIKNITVEPADIYSLENAPTLPHKLDPDENVEFKVLYSPKELKSTKKSNNESEAKLKIESDAEEPVTEVPIFSAIVVNDSTDRIDVDPTINIDVDPEQEGNQVSLRAAINHINDLKTDQSILVTFKIPSENVPIIKPKSSLPEVKYRAIFDASTQEQGYVVIDGSLAGEAAKGLVLKSAFCEVRSINIMSFHKVGIEIIGEMTFIDDCVIMENGTQKNNFEDCGLYIGSRYNKITNCIISKNITGIRVHGNIANYNKIIGCKIGVDWSGTEARGNESNGVEITNGLSNCIYNNVISGNGGAGVSLNPDEFGEEIADSNIVSNNFIGVGIDGKTPIGNKFGVLIGKKAHQNKIDSNVISGNDNVGIGALYCIENDITDNLIGTDLEEKVAIPNGDNGIAMIYCFNNSIKGNTIVSNKKNGIYICSIKHPSFTPINHIYNNYIGYTKSGYNGDYPEFGNSDCGIYISDSRPDIQGNFIGGHTIGGRKCGIFLEYPEEGILHGNNIHQNGTGLKIIGDFSSPINKDDIQKNKEIVTISKNKVYDNQTGIMIQGVRIAHIKSNAIFDNTGSSTGLHIQNSGAVVMGNYFHDDFGNAITVEGTNSEVSVSYNNIVRNYGYGLQNLNPTIPVDARKNYWWHSSGPSGYGPGSGEEISDGVIYSDWYTDPVFLYAAAEADTIFAPVGKTDSTLLSIENINLKIVDTITVQLSDDKGWIHEPKTFEHYSSQDSIKKTYLLYTIPVEIQEETNNTVYINAKSNQYPFDSIKASFVIIAEYPQLKYLVLSPDTINVESEANIQFKATGYDQFYSIYNPTLNWRCTSGAINENGLFTAGTEKGSFYVVTEDPVSGICDTSVVIVTNATQVGIEDTFIEKPEQLFYNYPNPFFNSTTIQYQLDEPGFVSITIYNSTGQQIEKLINNYHSSGKFSVNWHPADLENGIYISKIEISDAKENKPKYSEVRKMIYYKLE